jgi:hypothetical protein
MSTAPPLPGPTRVDLAELQARMTAELAKYEHAA